MNEEEQIVDLEEEIEELRALLKEYEQDREYQLAEYVKQRIDYLLYLLEKRERW
ncbi:MAG: hypothetical protein QW474_02235 [Candidatus Aenigmatarchaeota archaeon]